MEYARFWTAISSLNHNTLHLDAHSISIRGVETPTEERVAEIQQVASRYAEIY